MRLPKSNIQYEIVYLELGPENNKNKQGNNEKMCSSIMVYVCGHRFWVPGLILDTQYQIKSLIRNRVPDIGPDTLKG